MRRRGLLTLPLLLAGCGLSQRPYVERRDWPLLVPRPPGTQRRPNGKVLEVRTLRAAPGLELRGLQTLQPDGSIRTEFYEEWAAPPAQATGDALRRWLAASGLFTGVVGTGSRAVPDLSLEGELTALWSNPSAGHAHAAIGLAVVSQRGDSTKVVLQRQFTADTPLTGTDPAAAVQAQSAALADVFRQIETALANGAS